MAEQEKTAVDVQLTDADGHSYVAENRRYVGRKETVGYVIWDMAQSFNINAYNSRFVTNILQISICSRFLPLSTVFGMFVMTFSPARLWIKPVPGGVNLSRIWFCWQVPAQF